MGRNHFEGVPVGHFSVWWNAYSAETGLSVDNRLFDALDDLTGLGSDDMPGLTVLSNGFVACPRLAAAVTSRLDYVHGDVRVDGHQVYQDEEGVWRDGLFRMALPSPTPEENRGTWEMSGMLEHAWVKVFVPDGYPGDVQDFVRFKAAGLGRADGLDAWDHVLEQEPAVRLNMGETRGYGRTAWTSGVLCDGVRPWPDGFGPPERARGVYADLKAHKAHTRGELTEMFAMKTRSTPEPPAAAREYRAV